MHTSYAERGLWWLPQSPDKRISGEVKFSGPDGAILDLEGFFTNSPRDEAGQRISFIHGMTKDGECVTLQDCQRGSSKSGSGVPEVRYHCGTMFVGRYYLTCTTKLPVRAVEAVYSNLDEWADIGNFTVETEGTGKYTIYCEPYQEHIVATLDDFTLIIYNAVSSGPLSSVQTEFSVRQQWVLSFRTTGNHDVSPLLDWVFLFQQFLTLAMGGRCHPVSTVLVIEKSIVTLDLEAQHYREMFDRLPGAVGEPPVPEKEFRIRVFSSHTSFRTDINEIRADDMIFTLESAGSQLGIAVSTWFAKAAYLKPVLDFYFGALFSNQIYAEHYFLSMIQVLETFHRRTIQNTTVLNRKTQSTR